jgi:hypothetical protein
MTDYTPYLHVTDDGHIWWLRQDALRLGAGFLPVCDDNQQLESALQAPNRRALVNEKNLMAALDDARSRITKPITFERDGFRYVDAAGFLEWLSQYICQTQAKIEFPNELVDQVRIALAKAAAERLPTEPPAFESLTLALEGEFEKTLDELPDALRHRVEHTFLVPWGSLSPSQRRSLTEQWDYQHDPATEVERQYWWDFFQRRRELEKQIETWECSATPTASDLAMKEDQLTKLRQELASMDREQREARGDNYPAGSKHGKKGNGHLDHDPELQKRANEIAAAKRKEAKRPVTRNKVAQLLAKEVGMDEATVLRRIRKQWK